MALSLHFCAFFFKFIFELGGQRRNSERDDSNVWVVVGYACVRVTEQKGGGVGAGQHICIIWLLLKWHVFLKKSCHGAISIRQNFWHVPHKGKQFAS